MIKRDWLVGIGLLSGGLGAALGGQAAWSQAAPIGAVAAVNPQAEGQQPGAASQTLMIGASLVQDETIKTDSAGLVDVMFADQSSLTVGANSEVVLDKFVYDPASQTGELAINIAQGAMRFIGGRISKTNAVEIHGPTATMSIRGGIGLFYFPPGRDGYAVFVYGRELKILDKNGVEHLITRPGFAMQFPADGSPPIGPIRLTAQQLDEIKKALESQSGNQGGGPDGPPRKVVQIGSDDLPDRGINDLPLGELGIDDQEVLDSLNRFVVVDSNQIS